jgi:cellulose synthase/poly-beta-1,6-N-acetylglucosamine synthase-like glycosyltransferase
MAILFWTSLAFVAYTYFGYPLLLLLFSSFKSKPESEAVEPEQWPTVGFVIPIHNERKHLERKVANLFELDYPADRIRFYFSSDGSEDGSNEYLSTVEGVSLLSYSPRQGKPTAINTALPQLQEDIVVFSDARQVVAKDAIKKLVSRLLLPGIGAVSGELHHYDAKTNIGNSVGLYWRYEKWIRTHETMLHSVAGVTGALYCIYRKDFSPIPSDSLLDDFEVPIRILKSGRRIVLESGAIVFDSALEDAAVERVRKIRTIAGNFQSFSRHKWLFSPLSNPIWFQFISHKVFRLLVPYALLLMLIGSFLATGWFYLLAAVGQVLFYLLALVGPRNENLKNNKLVSIIIVFCQLNMAAVLGLKQYLSSSTNVKWEKTS